MRGSPKYQNPLRISTATAYYTNKSIKYLNCTRVAEMNVFKLQLVKFMITIGKTLYVKKQNEFKTFPICNFEKQLWIWKYFCVSTFLELVGLKTELQKSLLYEYNRIFH